MTDIPEELEDSKKSEDEPGKPKRSRKLPKYIPLDEIIKLLATPYATDKKHKLILWLGCGCGLRGGEINRLVKENIDIKEKLIHIIDGKGKKDREVPIVIDKLVIELETYLKDVLPGQLVFNITTTEALNEMIKTYARRAGITRPVNFHMLRHSFAVHSLKAGVDLKSVQKTLGHKSMQTTAIYLDLDVNDVKEEYRKHPLPF
jgi:integrase/recombinase XerD